MTHYAVHPLSDTGKVVGQRTVAIHRQTQRYTVTGHPRKLAHHLAVTCHNRHTQQQILLLRHTMHIADHQRTEHLRQRLSFFFGQCPKRAVGRLRHILLLTNDIQTGRLPPYQTGRCRVPLQQLNPIIPILTRPRRRRILLLCLKYLLHTAEISSRRRSSRHPIRINVGKPTHKQRTCQPIHDHMVVAVVENPLCVTQLQKRMREKRPVRKRERSIDVRLHPR